MQFDILFPLIFGTIWGSFLSVFVERSILQVKLDKKKFNRKSNLKLIKKKYNYNNKTLSIFYPSFSFCFNCGKKLKYYELIPLITYVINSGKCTYCNYRYEIRIMLFELLHGLFFIFVFKSFGYDLISIILCFNFSFLFILIYNFIYKFFLEIFKPLGIFLIFCNILIFL